MCKFYVVFSALLLAGCALFVVIHHFACIKKNSSVTISTVSTCQELDTDTAVGSG